MFDADRNQLRQVFFTAWQHYQNQQPLSPLEAQVCDVILAHPEYQPILMKPERYLDQDYQVSQGEPNPFLHLGLHLGILEQIHTDRPAGIATIYRQLTQQLADSHLAQHKMMECLAEMLYQAQRTTIPLSETVYLQQLQSLLTAYSK